MLQVMGMIKEGQEDAKHNHKIPMNKEAQPGYVREINKALSDTLLLLLLLLHHSPNSHSAHHSVHWASTPVV